MSGVSSRAVVNLEHMMHTHALAGTLVGLGLILTACAINSDSSAGDQPANEATVSPGSSEGGSGEAGGPLPDGGAVSCVESYSPESLQDRDFAFDGVVIAMGPSVSDRADSGDLDLPGITFEVREWFAGGDADEVTVDLQGVAEGTAEADLPFQVGTRLLVSGEPRWGGAPLDSPIAWGCGFSRYYDEETATTWRESTRG
ncbi:hypothetical protein MWU75_12770 [Ornithinimicrobium sp. F0845]|uniref:hypothetical protein n=1 Tax=Ornithinimicrobium sp. F0845 TaxID=2926412 RepID=UPI001FF44F8F|nr:hypothetical protein [Ornithinimicrobium sp. F0845]MCK0113015.1 hypothetical protein [Ornithinimicrobium sp. F0845]